MTALDAALPLFLGVVAILLAATVGGQYLARRRQPGSPDPVIENLNARIASWWAMTAILGLAFIIGNAGVIVLFALLSFMALREFFSLLHTRRGDHLALWSAFFVVLPIQYVLIHIDWYGLYTVFIPVYAFLLMPIVAVLRGDSTRFMDRIAEVQWALMTCVFCVSHVPALLTLDIPGYTGRHLLLIAFLVLVVQGSDVLQYVWGKLAGRHRIAPALSPTKTVEGFVGGVASATVLGAALWWITPFSLMAAAGMAFVIALMGFLGGLVMSAIKRDRGVKDWSDTIAGHGGVLDRLDSVIFAAPVFFHLTRYWYTV
jgi:phosphatidate cytidylyltransferase